MRIGFALLVLAALVAVGATAKLLPVQDAASTELDAAALLQRFDEFKKTYKRQYKSVDEEARALAAFGRNMQRAHELNVLHKGAAQFGVTKFSDVDPSQMRRGMRSADGAAK
ncbi:MAG: hypothetical protein Q8J97_08330, partial [Flavobacteriaceae bacterium]|nr:hypothetical protein [Flavobacteriaceae bacterium]